MYDFRCMVAAFLEAFGTASAQTAIWCAALAAPVYVLFGLDASVGFAVAGMAGIALLVTGVMLAVRIRVVR